MLLLIFIQTTVLAQESSYGAPIKKENYEISRSKIERDIKVGEILKDEIIIKNNLDYQTKVSLSKSDSISRYLEFASSGIIIAPKNETSIPLSLIGKEIGLFSGNIILSGDISEIIPVNLTILNSSSTFPFMITTTIDKDTVYVGKDPQIILRLKKINDIPVNNISLNYELIDQSLNETIPIQTEQINLEGNTEIRKTISSQNLNKKGFFTVNVQATYQTENITSSQEFEMILPWYETKIYKFPLWQVLLVAFGIIALVSTYIFVRRVIESRKKYKMQIDYKTLAKKGDRAIHLGKIAETNYESYYEMDNMTTHTIVAGATGGGKSIAAQVIIEETLLKNVAVVVFDPTAQWSGMLRKCDDKKMLSFYPKFGLKPSDAKAFPGSVKFITDYRELVDLPKYITPGQINIFALNKLTPSEIDKFVANTIASIFKSGPDEHPVLRVLFVFDEVHRLLAKFGGSGKGFLQIERACREFRKWGFGIMLVSQVLSDFVGEIKANINTEVQMRTRDESDLNRIKTKYGEEFLQSLIKASVGVGMMVNPKYNRGRPYFVNFRPILHNTRRLSDSDLEKYNKYNNIVEDIEFQIIQLEELKIDTFDLKMELKLVKDKLMTGSFNVVDIYLEGLLPRIEKQWKTLDKTPKKREIKLIDESIVNNANAEAEKARKEWEKSQGPQQSNTPQQTKIDIRSKIVRAITFDNGAMISSLNELKDVLPTLENNIFNSKVKKKNEISEWVAAEIDPEFGKSLQEIKDKKLMLQEIEKFCKSKDEPKKEEKKE